MIEIYKGEKGTERAQRLLRWAFNSASDNQRSYTDNDLSRIFEKGYWANLFGFRDEGLKPNQMAENLEYIIPRFLSNEHWGLLGGNISISFTDKPEEFYQEGIAVYRPEKRGRVYTVNTDKNGNPHITFLVKTSIPGNPTDIYEVLSFMPVLGYFKELLKKSNISDFSRFISEKLKGLKTNDMEKFWQNFINSSITFIQPTPINRIPSSIEFSHEGELPPVFQHMIQVLSSEMRKLGYVESPMGVMMGNDFSVPLVIATGFLTDDEVNYVFNHHDQEKNFPLFELSEKAKSKFTSEDEDILKRYATLMYLNRYNGDDHYLIQLKQRINTGIGSFRKRILAPISTALGDPVDWIEFEKITDHLIDNIPHAKISKTIKKLQLEKRRILLFSYPLGDAVYGLVKALNILYPQTKIGFFGKVGVVIDENNFTERGRVVLPEYVATVGSKIIPFKNQISPKDCVIIPQADLKETLFSNNSLYLQSPDDIKIKSALPLLDMEAYWLQQICNELAITPYAIYYVSDQTSLRRRDNALNLTQSMKTSEGVLATLESAFTILYRWANEN